MKVRKAQAEDSKRIWKIRNHPVCRKFSGNSEIIPLANHISWFKKKYFSGQNNYCFVLVNEADQVAGYCRLDFDDENDNYIISIAIDPNYHAQGQGYELLSKTLIKFKRPKKILAEIKKENIASIKLFQKNNFKVIREDKNNFHLEYLNQNNGTKK